MKRYTHKAAVLTIALVVASSPVAARPRHFYTDWRWWIGEAVIVSAVSVDYGSVMRAQRAGATELNPLLGAHPTSGRVAGVGALTLSEYTFGHALAWHVTRDDRSTFWRGVGLFSVPVAVGASNGYTASTNFRAIARVGVR